MTNVADRPLLDRAALRHRVDEYLAGFIRARAEAACGGRLPRALIETLVGFLAGGKRLRPALCAIGAAAAGGSLGDEGVAVAGMLEMFHTFALIHDDVMDGSAARRGRPTVHVSLAAYYRELAASQRYRLRPAAAAGFGAAGAILSGDLALGWSLQMLNEAGLDAERLRAVRAIVDEMHHEVVYGQWLDLHAVGLPETDLSGSLAVIRYKTAKYTVERPLHLGATVAGAGAPVMAALTAFALPLGEAFQLRDDLLGAFGDPVVTGKPVLDDLREGKRTALLALAHVRAGRLQRATLRRYVGDPRLAGERLEAVRAILVETGAVAEVEGMIAARRAAAERALENAPVAPEARAALAALTGEMTERNA